MLCSFACVAVAVLVFRRRRRRRYYTDREAKKAMEVLAVCLYHEQYLYWKASGFTSLGFSADAILGTTFFGTQYPAHFDRCLSALPAFSKPVARSLIFQPLLQIEPTDSERARKSLVRSFDKALATLFCLAGGLVPWSDVLPEFYRQHDQRAPAPNHPRGYPSESEPVKRKQVVSGS